MKEIGSEFWNIPLTDKKQHLPLFENANWYLSGRSALNAVLDDICENEKVKTAALPSWCCDSMIKPFLQHSLKVFFYPVYLDDKNNLIQEIDNVNCDIVLAMDYFGFHNCPEINKNCIIIRDATHSAFCKVDYSSDYVFGSLRKWTGFYTGGFAWKRGSCLVSKPLINEEHIYCSLRKKAMKMKYDYICNNHGDKSYLNLFVKAEEWLDGNDICYGSTDYDISSLEYLDVSFICNQRRVNAEYLISNLSEYSFSNMINNDECPLFLPLFVDSKIRNGLRKHLINNSIYCPVHWGVSELHVLNDKTKRIYESELSIICDQRYDLTDMQRIVKTIKEYMG